MKTLKYFSGILVIAAGLLANSCVGDLVVTPIDPNANTADKALVDEASFNQFLTGVYLGFATSGYYGKDGDPNMSGLDGGASQYIRGLYHHSELTTDESVCGWNDQTIKNFHYMNWTTDDSFIYAFYSRIFIVVGMANEFIRQAKASPVEFDTKQQMIDEARVIRAIAYYHAIDNFGNVPFADETAVVGATPDQIKRADLYAWLERELLDLVNNSSLPAKGITPSRASKGAAQFLLAKLYLNAEVFSGKPAYDKCADVLKDIIGSNVYSLHTTARGTVYNAYQDLFLADNDKCGDEIIFSVEQDGVNTNSYGATNYIIFASTGDGYDVSEIGITSGWGGLRTTPEFYDLFSASDARNLFCTNLHQKEIDDIGEFKNGYGFKKFLNMYSDGTPGKEPGSVDTDFPMMRYADVLLMAAECEFRGFAVDGYAGWKAVRGRAGIATADPASLRDIVDERGRELYQECWRRNDLIRFGLFTSSDYLWQWKGSDTNKGGTSVDSYRNLFPIPDSDRQANTKLVQNKGYGAAAAE
ncbi:MAG: RagB/SusD family nutrient uptake outer membrane protein [Bacteroidales bacterium]|nr:RagB/SusD family nutrient uptake outer membrane protein [Bacteroidales bacterium]